MITIIYFILQIVYRILLNIWIGWIWILAFCWDWYFNFLLLETFGIFQFIWTAAFGQLETLHRFWIQLFICCISAIFAEFYVFTYCNFTILGREPRGISRCLQQWISVLCLSVDRRRWNRINWEWKEDSSEVGFDVEFCALIYN